MDGLFSPKARVLNEPRYFAESDSNDYVVLVALMIDSKDFCENRVICGLSTSDFSGDGTRLQSFRHGEAPEEERELRILALAAHKVEPQI
jgi:hypothetical protein